MSATEADHASASSASCAIADISLSQRAIQSAARRSRSSGWSIHARDYAFIRNEDSAKAFRFPWHPCYACTATKTSDTKNQTQKTTMGERHA